MFLFVFLSSFVFFIFYFYTSTRETFNYWKKKGVPYAEPTYFFGNLADVVFRKKNFREVLGDIYHSHQDARYVGCYQFFTRNLLLRDPDLIGEILNKQFEYFPDRTMTASKTRDSVWANTIVIKTAEDGWSKSRAKITSSFTGKNLRIMIPLMQKCVHNLTEYAKQKGGIIKLDMKDTFSKVASDIITSAAFGVSVNSIVNEKNLVYTIGKETTNYSGFRSLVFMGYMNFPKMMDLFRISIFNKRIISYFTNLVTDSIRTRQEYNLSRMDFIHLLTKDQENLDKELQMSTEEIVGHCITIFLGGTETLSTVLAMSAYELAMHPEIQNRIYGDIIQSAIDCEENVTYESISTMKYLDCVISELLRLHSPSALIDRMCVKPYTVQPKYPGEKPFTIEPGTCIWVPITQIQRDPKHFPDPDKFDPERFNSENKKSIPSNAYVPFGSGPRFCIGQRYALLVVKVVLIEIIKQYEFVRLPETPVPLDFRIDSFFLMPKGNLWVGLKPRQ